MRTFKKSIIAFSIFSIFSSSHASVNEKPIAGKVYDDVLIYDDEGNKTASFQDTTEGISKDYIFNKGAIFDGSEGTTAPTILVHNWGRNPNVNPDLYNTKLIFSWERERISLSIITGAMTPLMYGKVQPFQ